MSNTPLTVFILVVMGIAWTLLTFFLFPIPTKTALWGMIFVYIFAVGLALLYKSFKKRKLQLSSDL